MPAQQAKTFWESRLWGSGGGFGGGPVGAQVLQPVGVVEWWVGQHRGAALGEGLLEQLGLIAPAARVAEHALEERDALWPGHDRTERGAEGQLDVRARRALAVTERRRALDDEDDVRAVVTVSADHH